MDENLTQMLAKWQAGDAIAGEEALAAAYLELKKIAAAYLARERKSHTLVPTALVSEAYLRLLAQDQTFQNRGHFFGIAATMMRRILLDYSRQRGREKRGGDTPVITINEELVSDSAQSVDVLDLEEVLQQLEKLDARQAKIVELKFFAGLSVEEIALALDISDRTVKREWRMARAWLHQQLKP
ncbi:MAG: sigma-70 family RNA polymerase sigma factor [Acidobacteria bacterium]|nr:sigma-70 family RNA polymerase sigma factor [Acidobacteriota bacterium]